ncbi:putative DedA-family protein; possible cell membrane structure determinant [Pseudorhizobium banfieldiae]|uniref:Putative DedA-family protein possible cell membrane structure determinant n=1 Tax=Pseudorhizobium banfieldiae TaxID=1125847 RepID=L0NGZ8_9HYPH|nr:VTT domain-containing protein [Pseudorhizobium banfieldiae]CAD6615831.1 DedA family protein [arsenite-oxidising bacterium NT-25]CCF20350.1 putative DedA-family protein; possible cell membrane structure determinant [Pseudorhizobium banfieldiae]
MPEQLIAIVQDYGALGLAAILMASCVGLPVPSSLVMMALGSFLQHEDMDILPYFLIGFGGAVAGDQAGYMIGRLGSGLLEQGSGGPAWLATSLARAAAFQNRWSDLGIFLSRWLLSPLGPWVNLYSGLTHYSWARFSLLVIAGEFVWVSVYLGAGMLFSSSVAALADILGSLTWFLVTGTVAIALGWKLVTTLRSKSNPDKIRM